MSFKQLDYEVQKCVHSNRKCKIEKKVHLKFGKILQYGEALRGHSNYAVIHLSGIDLVRVRLLKRELVAEIKRSISAPKMPKSVKIKPLLIEYCRFS